MEETKTTSKKRTVAKLAPKAAAESAPVKEAVVKAAPAEKKIDYKDKVLVVLPYCADGAQGRELEFAVAGWRKHFKEDFLLVIVGGVKPEICDSGDDIMFVQSDRVDPTPGNYRQHIDYVKCFKAVHKQFPESKGFVFTADDGYAINNFDLTDVKVPKIDARNMQNDPNSRNGWMRDQAKTYAALKNNGYPVRCYTTHIPQWYEWDKLEELWERFDMENESYVFENLYFNIYYSDRIPVLLDFEHDIYRCPVTRQNANWDRIPEMLKTKIWFFNTMEGYSKKLEEILANYYGL